MKYFLTVFISVLLLTSCDDGDLITENFIFENVTVQKCNNSNILYKINAAEALIFNTPETNFPNTETVINTPRVVAIGGLTSLTYRKFATTTSTSNICDTPTIPVIEEWTVTGGTAEITTTKITDTNGIIIAYNHNIVFKNITFITPNKQIVYYLKYLRCRLPPIGMLLILPYHEKSNSRHHRMNYSPLLQYPIASRISKDPIFSTLCDLPVLPVFFSRLCLPSIHLVWRSVK